MSKSLVQHQFGVNAAAYATSAPHAAGASLARVVEVVRPQKTWAALDIATGAGHTAAAIAPHVASVIASDITPEMLAEAKALAAARGLVHMTTALADAEALPFVDAAFDLVTCRIAPHHFADIPRFVWEVRRVLRGGGTLALIDNTSPDEQSTPGFSKTELHEASIVYNTFEKLRDPSHVRCLTLSEWVEVLEDADLAIAHTEIVPKTMHFGDWVGRLKTPPDAVERLQEMLRTGSPALLALLRPQVLQGELWFTVDEAMIIARKASA